MRRVNARTAVIFTVIIAIIFIIYWPVFRWLVSSWLSNEFYSHGFIVPLVTAFFIWTKRDHLRTEEHSNFGYCFLILGGILYAFNLIWDINSLGALSLVSIITSLMLLFWGLRSTRSILFPLIFLLFMIPFPFIRDLAYNLQQISIDSSSWILESLGLPITTSGSEIHLGDIVFTIGLPCSGINTFIALLALAAVYAYILTGAIYKRWGVFILAFPVAIIANILRITSVILIAHYVNIETATGWFHSLSSPLFFILSFLIVVLSAWIMKCKINYGMFRQK